MISEREKHIEELELQNEEAEQELSYVSKKAEIRRLKREHGRDWKQYASWLKMLKVDKETASNLHGMLIPRRRY